MADELDLSTPDYKPGAEVRADRIAARVPKVRTAKAKYQRPITASTIPVAEAGDVTDVSALTNAATAAQVTAVANKEPPPDFWGSLYNTSTVIGTGYKDAARPMAGFLHSMSQRQDFDPAWGRTLERDYDKLTKGLNEDEVRRVIGARNEDDFKHRMFKVQEMRDSAAVYGKAGTAAALAGGVLGGILEPTAFVTGLGVGKGVALAKVGSAAYLAAGRPIAALGSTVGENLLASVATTAAYDAMGEYQSSADYLSNAIGDTGVALAFGGRSFYKAMKAKADVHAVNTTAELGLKAADNVGPHATKEQVSAEMTRLEAERVNKEVSTMGAKPGDRDRMVAPDIDHAMETAEATPKVAAADFGRGQQAATATTPDTFKQAASWDPVPEGWAARRERLSPGGEAADAIRMRTGGAVADIHALDKLAPGVHASPAAMAHMPDVAEAVNTLAARFLGKDHKLTIHVDDLMGKRGDVVLVSDKAAMIRVSRNLPAEGAARTAFHEVGHVVFQDALTRIKPELRGKLDDAYKRMIDSFKTDPQGWAARMERFSLTNDQIYPRLGAEQGVPLKGTKYDLSRDEHAAEQFVKYLEEDIATGNKVELPSSVRRVIKDAVMRVLEFLRLAKRKNVGVSDEYRELFDTLLSGAMDQADEGATPTGAAGALSQADMTDSAKALLPSGNPREAAMKKAVIDLHKQADVWVAQNPLDKQRADVALLGLGDVSKSLEVTLPATVLANSENSVARMFAGVIVEQASGAQGRRATAAIAKVHNERHIVGDALNKFDNLYHGWSKANGGGWIDAYFSKAHRDKWNRAVAVEIEERLHERETDRTTLVARAADVLEQAYERSATLQRDSRTVGFAALPSSSTGYMPHILSQGKMLTLSIEQRNAVVNVLAKQFQELNDFDPAFAHNLAIKYMEHARTNALGGHEIPANVTSPHAAEMVRESLKAMGMTPEEVLAAMGRYSAGGASHTKARLQLDLNEQHTDSSGAQFTLMDLFSTDHTNLLRSQSRRVGGEVALTDFGIQGSQGLAVVREALKSGDKPATPREMRAFDQMASEFLGKPVSRASNNVLADGLTAYTSLVRLGGIAFSQLAEPLNLVYHLGAYAGFKAALSTPRILGEVNALKRGHVVENGLLSGVESYGGAGPMGMEGYRMVTPFDNPDSVYETSSHDSAGLAGRLLALGSHAATVASGLRILNAVQRRSTAEQIILKSWKHIKNGGQDAALTGMGVTPDIAARLKADMQHTVVWEGGNVKEFLPGNTQDTEAMEAFMQAISRGTEQIIQGTFIGERGFWVHDSWGRMFTQFRNYTLVAMEKQVTRQRADHGNFKFAVMLGAGMVAVLPLHLARVQLNALGREDREAYIERQMQPEVLARALMNYLPQTGLAPDIIEFIMAGVQSAGYGSGATGTARGGGTSLTDKLVPAAGMVTDIGKGLAQLPKMLNPEADVDQKAIVKPLPGSRLPWVVPWLNAFTNEAE